MTPDLSCWRDQKRWKRPTARGYYALALPSQELSAVNGMLARVPLPHQSVVNIHQLRIVIILKDELPRPHPSLLPQQRPRAEMSLQLLQRRTDVRIHMKFCRRSGPTRSP